MTFVFQQNRGKYFFEKYFAEKNANFATKMKKIVADTELLSILNDGGAMMPSNL